MKKIPQDIFGDIAILKFRKGTLWITRKLKARKFLRENKGVRTVLEKVSGFSGRLRKHKTRYLAGVKTKEAIYKENGCVFRFNVDEVYFSPRLSNERKLIADDVLGVVEKKKNSKILVMFAGISPYPIVIARKLKRERKKALIYSNELNRRANEIAKRNVVLNKVGDYISFVSGDAKKIPSKIKEKFDVIVMPRPNLKDTFLKAALELSKRGTEIFYHGFGTEEGVLKEIKRDAGGKIGRVKIRRAGDIGAYKYRWLARFRVR